jgi:predicted HTH transcriptional regulator
MNEISDSLYQPFSDFFSQPSREKLTAILTQNLGEFDHLDFKAEIFVGSNLAKHILAFANSRGGAIVFGIVENDDRSLDPKGCLLQRINLR